MAARGMSYFGLVLSVCFALAMARRNGDLQRGASGLSSDLESQPPEYGSVLARQESSQEKSRTKVTNLESVGKSVLWDATIAGTYTVLCINAREQSIHAFTWGLAVVCLLMVLLTGATAEDTSTWNLFRWAKRLSLIVGWAAFVFVWQAAQKKDQWPAWVCIFARRFAQFVLMANVAEAGLLMSSEGNYAAGIPCLFLACFSLDWSHLDEEDRLASEKNASIFGYSLPFFTVTARWYTRLYYILLSFCLCQHAHFASMWIFVYWTCLWPLFYQEVIDTTLNPGIIFKIRAFMLICTSALLDTFVHKGTLEMSTWVRFPEVTVMTQNSVSAACLLFFVLLFAAVDQQRADDAAAAVAEKAESAGER